MSRKRMSGRPLALLKMAVAPRGVSVGRSGATSPGASRATALGAIALAVSSVLTAGCGGTSNPDPLPNMEVVKSIRGSAGEEASGEADVAATTGEGWGTLRGRFVLNGDAPTLSNLTATKDAEVCGQTPLIDNTFVVGDDKGIANIVVFAFKTSRVKQEALDAALAEPVLFDQKGCLFLTRVLPVVVGQSVTLRNSDPVSHNTSIAPQGDRPANPILAQNGEVPHTFGRRQSNPFAVSCSIHPWMKAYMFPRDDPYVAVSAADGSFEIANLPAGEEIQFRIWHETATGGLVAKSDWGKGRFTETIEADGTKDLGDIAVPVAAFSLP